VNLSPDFLNLNTEPLQRDDVDPNSRLAWACFYADHGCYVLPILDKKPASRHGHLDATRDPEIIRGWFTPGWDGFKRDIAIATGARSGVVVLDIDIKNGVNGWDSLAELGMTVCPQTPLSHSPSGGAHLWFQHPGPEFFVKSLSPWIPGVDLKADRSSCSAPPASGRRWDAHLDLTVPLAALPLWVPRERVRQEAPARAKVQQKAKIDAYGSAALRNACMAIADAENGSQQETLNTQAYGIGRLVGGDEIDAQEARRRLIWAAERMREHAHRWPMVERTRVIDRGLSEGQKNPRKRPKKPPQKAEPMTGWNAAAHDAEFTVCDTATPAASPQPYVPASEPWCDDDEPIAPREWLLANVFCKYFLSGLTGRGGSGKTALRVAQAMSVAIGRSLTGEHVFRQANVLFISFEDHRIELKRRIRACRLHHNVSAEELRGKMFVWNQGDKIVAFDPEAKCLGPGPVVGELIAFIREKKIEL
jgi:hypothetical protein